MKVAAFLYAYPPDRLAGADLMSADLLTDLTQAGHEVHVFSTMHTPPREDRGVVVQSRTQFRRQAGWDCVYAHPDLGAQAPQMAHRLGVPYVGVVHNTDARTGRWLTQWPPDLTVWNAHSTREAHRGEGGVVIRSPLIVADHQTQPGDAVTLVNLNRAKGVDLFWALAGAWPGRSFLGVRGGWGVQHDKEVPSNARVIGPVPHPMREVWANTRVLLMPSESESWGRVALEAACSGIPTIAHPTPGLVESLGEAGVFVDRNDPAGWARALHMLDNPATYAARSRKARARAREVEEQTRHDRGVWVDTMAALCGATILG